MVLRAKVKVFTSPPALPSLSLWRHLPLFSDSATLASLFFSEYVRHATTLGHGILTRIEGATWCLPHQSPLPPLPLATGVNQNPGVSSFNTVKLGILNHESDNHRGLNSQDLRIP